MTGFEPAASTSRTYLHVVPSENPSGLTESDTTVCTSVCTSELEKRRKPGSDAALSGPVENAEAKPVETDFAAALMMLAKLPLSDEERAEAVRRLLDGM